MSWTRENKWRAGLVVLGVIFLFAAPNVFQLFTIINMTTAIAFAILALSRSFHRFHRLGKSDLDGRRRNSVLGKGILRSVGGGTR